MRKKSQNSHTSHNMPLVLSVYINQKGNTTKLLDDRRPYLYALEYWNRRREQTNCNPQSSFKISHGDFCRWSITWATNKSTWTKMYSCLLINLMQRGQSFNVALKKLFMLPASPNVNKIWERVCWPHFSCLSSAGAHAACTIFVAIEVILVKVKLYTTNTAAFGWLTINCFSLCIAIPCLGWSDYSYKKSG